MQSQSEQSSNKMDTQTRTEPDLIPHRYDFNTALSLGLCSAIEDELDLSSVASIDNGNLLGAKIDSELESDGSSFSYSSGTDSSAESDSEVDDSIAMEFIDEIRTQKRICSTIEDYDDGELVFSEADLKLWKKKEKALMQRYKKGTTGANKSMLRYTRSFLPYTNLISQKKH